MSTKDEKGLVEPTPEAAGDIPATEATLEAMQKSVGGAVELDEDELDQVSGGYWWRVVGGQIKFRSDARVYLDCAQSRNPWKAHQYVEYGRDGNKVYCRCSYCGLEVTFDADSTWYIRKEDWG